MKPCRFLALCLLISACVRVCAASQPVLPTATCTPVVTQSPTFTWSPTLTKTVCGVVYSDRFTRYRLGTPLFGAPGYLSVTGSLGDWVVGEGLGGRVAEPGEHNTWTWTRYKGGPYKGYFDLKMRCGIPKGGSQLEVFWHSNKFSEGNHGIPVDGYYIQVNTDGRVFLQRGPSAVHPLSIAYGSVLPGNYADFRMEIEDNYGVISVYVDGSLTLKVEDHVYESGFWGFGTDWTKAQFTDISLNLGSCRPANTHTPTEVPTPAPAFKPEPCASPFPRVFTPVLTPIMMPTYTWEGQSHQEPSVIKIKGLWHMTYSANSFAWDHTVVGLKTSKDGLHWTQFGDTPILGAGYGGEPKIAGRSSQLKVGEEYRVYYADILGNVRYATSEDGFHYQAVTKPVVSFNSMNARGINKFDSAGFCYDKGAWWMVLDTECYTCPAYFQVYLFKSTDNARTFEPVAGPLYSQVNNIKGATWGSSRTLIKIGNTYHNWYLVGVPSEIYHAASPDLYNWYPDQAPILKQDWHMFGLEHANQAADPCVVQMDNGKTYLYFDGVDNNNYKARIGVAIYDGTLEDLVNCGKKE